jgi:hypothetical protein
MISSYEAVTSLGWSFQVGRRPFLPSEDQPVIGRPFRGSVVRTVVRGTTVVRDGRIVSEPVGRFIQLSRRISATLGVGAGQAGQPSQTSGTRGGDVQQPEQPN